jgi:hypothetical protein
MNRILGIAFCAAAAAGADLPVKHVILYKHGVGYFERSGELRPGESARLDFKAAEMNDVLKSLTVGDLKGGKISGLRYDSSDPLARKLSEFPFRLGEQQPLVALLDSLKGARVQVRLGPETLQGAVVSARLSPGGEQRPERELLTLLVDSGDIRTIDLSGATNLRFQDAELQNMLQEYFAALTGARSRDKRSVYIDSTGAAGRQIVAGYMVPTPVWKSSYRLIFGEGADPTLEGWAIVDNVTGEDWTGVRLALVSGRPISFISRLYEPRYVNRPYSELPEEQAAAPVVHGGAIEEESGERRRDQVRKEVAMRAAALAEPVEAKPMAGLPAPRPFAPSAVASVAETRDAGELFEYQFALPVTVRKGESAMLPFVQQKVTARKLLIFSDRGSEHPTNAAEITNSTGKTLDGGPITVYDAGVYAGEALVETVKTGDKRLISYAVDLGVRITTRFDSSGQTLREVHFRRGVLTTRHAIQETKTFTIRNVEPKAKTLVIEHPVRPGFKLVNVKPAETTQDAYRFELKVGPAATDKFPVIEEHLIESSTALANITPDVLGSYLQNKELSETARKQLGAVLAQKRLIADADRAMRVGDQEHNDLSSDQDRLRRNISSLSSVPGQQEQVQVYARQLAATETKLAALRDRLAELRKKKAALESELNSLIEQMEF